MPVEGDQRLTIFGDDDVSPITDRDGTSYGTIDINGVITEPTFTSEAGLARPYLHINPSIPKAGVDLLRGKASIAGATLKVLDKRRQAGDQSTGIFTYLLPNADGESNLTGRRVLWEEYQGGTWVVLLNAVIDETQLDTETLVDFDIGVRDIRDRARRLTLFNRASTTTVLPRGVLNGWGKPDPDAGESEWVVPPVTPLRGEFFTQAAGGIVDLGTWYMISFWPETWGFNPPPGLDELEIPIHARMNDVIRKLVAPRFEDGSPHGHLQVLWRRDSSEAWKSVGQLNFLQVGDVGGYDSEGNEVAGTDHLNFNLSSIDQLPAENEVVDVVVAWNGPPTKEAPLHIEEPFNVFLRKVLDGEYSVDEAGNPVPLNLPYDEAAVDAITEPVLARVTEPVGGKKEEADGRRAALSFLESHGFQPLGSAPALNDGLLYPIRYRLPAAGEPVHELDDAGCISAQWSQGTSNAVNFLEYKFKHYVRVPPEDDPEATETETADTVFSQDVTLNYRHQAGVTRVGEQKLSVETILFSALSPKWTSQDTAADLLTERATRLARALSQQAFDRWPYGGQVLLAEVRRSIAEDWKVGDWVHSTVSWLPDYATGVRGMDRLLQVTALGAGSERSSRSVELVDAGPDNQPLALPTLGAMTVDSVGRVTMPVTNVPAGAEAHVQYAVNTTEPAANSSMWVTVGRGPVDDYVTPAAPSGSTVWRRARSEAEGRRPSDWTVADSIAIPARPTIRESRAWFRRSSRETFLEWGEGRDTAGVRLYYVAHAEGVEPDFGTPDGTVDLDATNREHVLPASVATNEALSVRIEPWTGWTGAVVSGTAGAPADHTVATPSAALTPAAEQPIVGMLKQVQGSAENRTDVTVRLSRASAAGTLRLWTAPASLSSPDPMVDVPDDEITLAAGSAGRTVGPVDSPALDDVLANPRETKHIFAEYVTDAGVTSGIVSAVLRSFASGLDPNTGRVDPDVELVGGETIENKKRARMATMLAKYQKQIEEERSGFAGVPGSHKAGIPVLDSDGLETLVDPQERKIGTALKYPGGQGIDAYRPEEPGANVTETRTSADTSAVSGKAAGTVRSEAEAGALADDDLTQMETGGWIDRANKRVEETRKVNGRLASAVDSDAAAGRVADDDLTAIPDVDRVAKRVTNAQDAEALGGEGQLSVRTKANAGDAADTDLSAIESAGDINRATARVTNALDAQALGGEGQASVRTKANAGDAADTDLSSMESAGHLDRATPRILTAQRIQDEVGSGTIENTRRARVAALQGYALKTSEEKRSGVIGVPGSESIGMPILDADGLATLLDPVTKRLIGENVDVEKVGDPATAFGLGEKIEAVESAIRDLNRIRSGVKYKESGGTALGILRGLQWGFARDGDSVTFPTAYESAPPFCHVFPVGRCKTYESGEAGDQLIVCSADDVTATGFDVYAKLHAPQGATTTARYAAFGAGGDMDELGEVHGPISPSNLPAYDDWYQSMVNGQIETNLDPKYSTGGSVEYVIALETDKTGGGSWVEVASATFTHEVLSTGVTRTAWSKTKINGTVSGVNGSGRFRLVVKSFSNTSNADVVLANTYFRGSTNTVALDHGLHWYTSSGTADNTYPMTPGASDAVLWVALNGAE